MNAKMKSEVARIVTPAIVIAVFLAVCAGFAAMRVTTCDREEPGCFSVFPLFRHG